MLQKTNLAQRHCVPCSGGVRVLAVDEQRELLKQLDPDWRVVDRHHLEREFAFKDFREALDFTNHVGEIAEDEGHHPDIVLSYGKVAITLFTHKISGLTESDFVVASKIDELELTQHVAAR